MAVELFRAVPDLSMNGTPFAQIGATREVIFFGVGNEETDCFTVAEARQIRDWLNSAIDGGSEHE
jgi:hypothetical protein